MMGSPTSTPAASRFLITTGIVSREDLGGAELDDLRSRVVDRRVAGRDVVGVAGLVGLLAIREAEAHLPLDHVAPAGKLGAVVGQAAEQIREVGVGGVRLEADASSRRRGARAGPRGRRTRSARTPSPWIRWACLASLARGRLRPRLGSPRARRIG